LVIKYEEVRVTIWNT